jgi:hypothetical protein
MMYQQMIRQELAHEGHIGLDPRHVEAWMRLEHGTLDALSGIEFQQEVAAVVDCILVDGPASERLAQSYGL